MVTSRIIEDTVLLTDTYQKIYPHPDDDHPRDPRWHEGWMFFNEMTAGDEVYVLIEVYDAKGQLLKGFHLERIIGSQGLINSWHMATLKNRWVRIWVRQSIAPSTYKSVNFSFYEDI